MALEPDIVSLASVSLLDDTGADAGNGESGGHNPSRVKGFNVAFLRNGRKIALAVFTKR